MKKFILVFIVVGMLIYLSCGQGDGKNYSSNIQPNNSINSNNISENKQTNEDREYIEILDRHIKQIKFDSLSKMRFDDKKFEIRIWKGFGINKTQGVFIRRQKEVWSGDYIEINSVLGNGSKRFYKITPKSGWDNFWQKIEKQEILTIPDDSVVGSVEPFEDSEIVIIEVLTGRQYRSYSYNEPCLSKTKEGQKVSEILKIITEETGNDFSKCPKL